MGCTLSRTIVCSLAAIAALVCALAAGCGGDDQPATRTESFHRSPLYEGAQSGTLRKRACSLLAPRRAARLAGRPDVALRPHANDSTDLSMCVWRGQGLVVQLIVDAAPRAQLRYYDQLAEQLEFHNTEPARRPRQLRHVGDDSAYGGAGAWWTPSKGQLVAYGDERIVRVRVVARGSDDAARRRACARLARAALRRLG